MRESWSAPGDPAVLAAEFADWDPWLSRLLSQIDATFRWGLCDRDPLPRWTHGRLTLLGDAAHAMLPHMGQGANQAIEDGMALATLMRDAGAADVTDVLIRYQACGTTIPLEFSKDRGPTGCEWTPGRRSLSVNPAYTTTTWRPRPGPCGDGSQRARLARRSQSEIRTLLPSKRIAAAVGEIGERLVDGFARCADQLSDLFLRQVVRHTQRVALLGAEPLRQLQQLLGDPAGHVGEHQVGQVVVGATQPAGQHSQQLLGDFGPIGDPRAQRVAVHRHRAYLGDGGRARRARTGSKIDNSPNMSDGPMTVSRFSRPSGDRRPILTFPEMMMNSRSPGSPSANTVWPHGKSTGCS